jgi:adenylate kinase
MLGMNIILFGPQAAGKGTQAELLAHELGIDHINVGERLRHEAASGSRLGHEIKAKIDAGELVDDKLVERLVKQLLQEAERGFVMDGFPRDEEQAAWLDLNAHIDTVIMLKVSESTTMMRIGGRRECPKGHDFHIVFKPSRKEGLCDECGLPLSRRADDTEEAIKKRLKTYHDLTQPMIKHYGDKVISIDGEQSIMDVHRAIMRAIRS